MPDGALTDLKPRHRNRLIYRGPIFGTDPTALVNMNLRSAKRARESAVHYFRRASEERAKGSHESDRFFKDEAYRYQTQARIYYSQAGLLFHLLAAQQAAPAIRDAETAVFANCKPIVGIRHFASIRYVGRKFTGAIYSYSAPGELVRFDDLPSIDAIRDALARWAERMESEVAA